MCQVNFNFLYKLIDFFGILSTLAPPPTPPRPPKMEMEKCTLYMFQKNCDVLSLFATVYYKCKTCFGTYKLPLGEPVKNVKGGTPPVR